MDNQPVDNSPPKPDNSSINDENGVLHISMGDKRPINDPNCQHRNVVKDPTEELGDAYICQDCKVGWIMPSS